MHKCKGLTRPEGSFNPVTPNKCRGIFCKHFTVYNDREDSYNCKCEKSGEWIDLQEEELDKENELICPNNAFEPAETTLYPAPNDIIFED